MATIEQFYKDFGVLAEAKDEAGEVSILKLSSYKQTWYQKRKNNLILIPVNFGKCQRGRFVRRSET